MTHLRKIGIQNFRSIEKANLKLGEITVVIGPSDSGKSNIARALKAWSYNAVSSGFTTEGKQTCRVAVAVGQRYKIVFEKNEKGGKHGRTRFILADAESGELVSFEKVGRTVPQEVVDVTEIRPIIVDDLKVTVHFAEQAEPWFLLASPPWTPATTSKIIGRVSGVDALILANRDVVNKRNGLRGEVKTLRSRADESRGRLDEFDGLDQLVVLLEQAEEAWGRLEGNRKKFAQAARLLTRVKTNREGVLAARERVGALRAVVGHVAKCEIEAKLDKLDLALAVEASMGSLDAKKVRAGNRSRRARDLLTEHADELKALAGDEGLECPLCGGPAHDGCREALKAQAKWAKGPKGALGD